MQDDIVLTMRRICKYFPGVRALNDVDFTLRKGTIHALMGENGAGKSTLIKVLTGVYLMDEGEIRIDGIEGPVTIRSPQEAQSYGISTVYQEITLCPNLTVAENMFIGRGEKKSVETAGKPGHSRPAEAAAGKLLTGRTADGCDCPCRRYRMQSADSGRADFLSG